MVTQKEIAKKCGVSIASVSAAFRRPKHLSKETREKILSTARTIGYIAAQIKIKNIGLVFKNFHQHFFSEYYNGLLFGIMERITELKLRVQIFENAPEKYQEVCEICGFLIIGNDSTTVASKIEKHGIPFILIEHSKQTNKNYPQIYFDTLRGIRQLADFIFTCNHQNIAIINGEPDPEGFFWQNYLQGIKEACLKNKVPAKKIKIYPADYQNLQTVEIAVNRILSKQPQSTCILCSNDVFAYYASQILSKNNIKIPEDLSIAGFNNIKIPAYLSRSFPRLTTVRSDRVKLGKTAVDSLLKLIQNPSTAAKIVTLETELLVGNTVRRIENE